MFWLGVTLGAVLFVPAAYIMFAIWEWLKDPQFPFGRNHGVMNFKRHENLQWSLAFMAEAGFETTHLCGTWYYVKRVPKIVEV